MQHYIRRGLAGRYRSSSDDLGEQFDPTRYSGAINVSQSSNVTQSMKNKTFRTEHLANQLSTREGYETISNYTNDTSLFER